MNLSLTVLPQLKEVICHRTIRDEVDALADWAPQSEEECIEQQCDHPGRAHFTRKATD